MKLTLTYRGPLPPKQRGVSAVKADLRRAFHPQIKAQVGRLLSEQTEESLRTTVGEFEFVSPAHPTLRTDVELDVLLLSPHKPKSGDVDNRLKTLVDGLTRPANPQQFQGFSAPAGGGPTFCLLDDDNRVQRLSLDSRVWHDPSAAANDALVVVTAKVVLSQTADLKNPMATLWFLVS